MEFVLFEVAKYEKQCWLSFFGFQFRDTYFALLHIEHRPGEWIVDIAGLRALYFWWKYRE